MLFSIALSYKPGLSLFNGSIWPKLLFEDPCLAPYWLEEDQ